jgi:hypothetical protein
MIAKDDPCQSSPMEKGFTLMDGTPIRAEPRGEAVRRLGVALGKARGPARTEATSLLVDYPEAARLLGVCRPKPGETETEAVRRGTNALKVRVSAGRPPRRVD